MCWLLLPSLSLGRKVELRWPVSHLKALIELGDMAGQ